MARLEEKKIFKIINFVPRRATCAMLKESMNRETFFFVTYLEEPKLLGAMLDTSLPRLILKLKHVPS